MDVLRDVMGMQVEYQDWHKTGSLPMYISGSYAFQKAEIDGISCIILTAKGELATIPALKKQITKIREIEDIPVVLRSIGLSPYRKKSMIENKIPFVTDKQVYLPFMGTLLSTSHAETQLAPEKFMASAQLLALFYLYSDKDKIYITDVRKQLPFSAMSITRAMKQIEATELFNVSKDGVNRTIASNFPGRELYEKIKKYMVSPVRFRGYTENNLIPKGAVLAGVSALSQQSMLNDDSLKTYAIYGRHFDKALLTDELVDPAKQSHLELWHYEPAIFAEGGIADPISVALSFNENGDERIEAAIEEMIEKMWT